MAPEAAMDEAFPCLPFSLSRSSFSSTVMSAGAWDALRSVAAEDTAPVVAQEEAAPEEEKQDEEDDFSGWNFSVS
jgi:hypothetical protein